MSSPEPGWSAEHVRGHRERAFTEREHLRKALRDTPGSQRAVLADLLEFNAGTEFGRAHGLAGVRGADDYRRAVPIHGYADLEPWIERMAAGERGLLTSDDPVVYFTSSGSTGEHKKVPVTRRFMRTSFFPFFYAAWAPMVEHHPDFTADRDAVLNLKHDPLPVPRATADGKPHLGASQVDFGAAFGEPLSAEPGSAATWAALPVPVAADDHLEKAYLRLRLAVEADVRGVIGINPAVVAALPHQLRTWWERLVRDVRDGTALGHRVREPNPERAARLEALASAFGQVRPAHVWPRVRQIFCWTGGVAALYLPRLREEYGIGVELLPAPVAASEGPTAVTLDRHPAAGDLAVTSSFYEFVPADTPITPDAATLLPHELEAGHEYQVVYSHVGGFYRYAGGDVVRVVDTEDGSPRVAYAGRAGVSDAAGERLRESHVVRALARATAETGLEVRNASCRHSPTADGVPGYEFALAPTTPWTTDETERLRLRLDAALAAESPGYRGARARRALAPARLAAVDGAAFWRDWHERVAEGTRPAQVKDKLFRQDERSWRRLVGAPRDEE
ncbi:MULTISPECIES: GH3 auxin-responsive promoter family protein [Actinosynnema]|uniref:GH3 auxin-responsive promoter family protein n=1 Tax=Actinosynnema TaxID=40566 RepID=UPI0020A49C73|nr:GH3 auxin-responsive promoter family protein [Actinosynnema pretiosum]MCP2094784.1 GH3 auxin-responsive promoter [Actinosynnema pretiosum]